MKKRFSILSLALMAGASMFGAPKQALVDKIEPPYWWTGMVNDTLQLMVSGHDVAKADVTVDYPGVRLAEEISL